MKLQAMAENNPLIIPDNEFRRLGHWLVDMLADHYRELSEKKITPGKSPAEVRDALGSGSLPKHGTPAPEVIEKAFNLLMSNSLFNSHPAFWGYIMGPGTQIGSLADMLAATVNPNCGGWELAPMAGEIERQCIRWIGEWVGYPADCGGVLVSGGAMANYIGFLTARTVKAPWAVRSEGLQQGRLKVYCSKETHTWIQKAADLFGLGTDAIEWIPTNTDLTMDVAALERAISRDRSDGVVPFLVIATAGSVSTGVVDDLRQIGELCDEYDLWFHVDGAYGGPVARLNEYSGLFEGIARADSIALDPHKWFYCPQEAGCALVRNPQHMLDTFSYRPPYYYFGDDEGYPQLHFYEYGLQNSRGFRALKVWTTLLQAGEEGMKQLIRKDIRMAKLLYDLLDQHPDFEAYQTNLSITTFRYRPASHEYSEEDLNDLNLKIMEKIQVSGDAFVTNAVVGDTFLLRACIVNHRTEEEHIRALPALIADIAAEVMQIPEA